MLIWNQNIFNLNYKIFMQPYREPEGERKTVAEYHIYMNKILGRGGFGTVYEGYNTKTQQVVAVKMIERTNSGVQSTREHQKIISLKRQATILNKVYSEYVVGFRDIIATRRYYYIIQEKCDTSLAQFLKQLKSKNEYLSEKQAIQLMVQILKGFYALIVLNISHRDVKPENFLMKNRKIKIADFGLSRKINQRQMMQTVVGTVGYQSPEVFHGEQYTSKCDVYSIGCVFYEILYLRRVFSVFYAPGKIQSRMLEIDNLQFPIEPIYSEKLKDLIRSCLRFKQGDRAGWIEVFNHEIFEGSGLPSLSKLNMALSYILSVIRKQIEAKSLNIEKYLEKIGILKNKQIGIQDYTKILLQLTPIDKRLNLEQIRYSFNYFDKDKSGTISYKQFVQVLESHGIIMSSNESKYNVEEIQKILFSQNASRTQKGSSNIDQIKREETNQVHKKLLQELVDKSLEDVIQNFELEDLSSEGITVDVFTEFIIKKLEIGLSTQECKLLFQMFDQNKDGRVQYEQFHSNIVEKFKTSKTSSSVE